MFTVTRERFEQFVDDAIDSIPDDLAAQIDNVAILVDGDAEGGGLLGLYEGVPLTKRGRYAGAMPDRITIYQDAICRHCASEDEVRIQVRATVLHEIGHHFGITDRRLHELGW